MLREAPSLDYEKWLELHAGEAVSAPTCNRVPSTVRMVVCALPHTVLHTADVPDIMAHGDTKAHAGC